MPKCPISMFARSAGVPWNNRGYHSSGTEIDRPSSKSTVSVSSVTTARVARITNLSSLTKKLMPLLQQEVAIFVDQLADYSQLMWSEALVVFQLDQWVDPKLRLIPIMP